MPIKKKRNRLEFILHGGEFDGTRFGGESSPLTFRSAYDFCDDRHCTLPSAQEMATFAKESGVSGKYWTRTFAAYFMREQELYVAFDDSPDSRLPAMVGFSKGYELHRDVDDLDRDKGLFGDFISRAERSCRVLGLYDSNVDPKFYIRAALGCASSICGKIKLPTREEAFNLIRPENIRRLWQAGEIRSLPKLAIIKPVALENGVLNAAGSFEAQNVVRPVFNPQPFKR